MKDKNEKKELKKEKRARHWQQTKKLTRRIVIGKPGEKIQTTKTKTLYLIVVFVFFLYLLLQLFV
ncbi:hypothetical protein YS9_2801 [Enterococcus sp. C1]|jgi:hypothetical protein|uniref:hypothetical protein n=1 Tax=Enterococcus TaxID=1350 RepID=UPI0002721E3D|nr:MULTISPECIES: hypothetical protein [Enterococcus]EJF48661.1 hypothetical protein YS9_2801 [Enterococcus sp. C1]MEB8418551.1 hypothetical protein [Enterococcus casseliflavus]